MSGPLLPGKMVRSLTPRCRPACHAGMMSRLPLGPPGTLDRVAMPCRRDHVAAAEHLSQGLDESRIAERRDDFARAENAHGAGIAGAGGGGQSRAARAGSAVASGAGCGGDAAAIWRFQFGDAARPLARQPPRAAAIDPADQLADQKPRQQRQQHDQVKRRVEPHRQRPERHRHAIAVRNGEKHGQRHRRQGHDPMNELQRVTCGRRVTRPR